eukprot:jgi/Picre1/32765/NNA_001051.t1
MPLKTNVASKTQRSIFFCRSRIIVWLFALALGVCLVSLYKRNAFANCRGYARPYKLRLIDLPKGTSKVIINIGSNLDPILPREDDAGTHAIAFEPVVGDLILPHPKLSIISAGVDESPGLATIYQYNDHGVSSSFSKPAAESFWNNDPNRDGNPKIVPVVSFRDVLDSIPLEVEISFIKTDMQGLDFKAVSSVGTYLRERKVKRLKTEVYLDNVRTYEGVKNDFCLSFLPYMTSIGYKLFQVGKETPEQARKHCDTHFEERPGLQEYDAYWVLSDLGEEDAYENYEYPLQTKNPKLKKSAAVNDESAWKSVDIYVGNSKYGGTKDWFSQSGQDQTVCKVFEIASGTCHGKFFLDLAANDAAYLSNTKSLEDRFGWNGICVEPNSEYLFGLAHRRCRVFSAVVATTTGGIIEFIEHPNDKPGWAGGIVSNRTDNSETTLGVKKTLEAVSLIDVLQKAKAPQTIDYFSFDIEGAEDMVLQENVLQSFKFQVISVERPSEGLAALLQKYGYIYLRDHGNFGDKMFVHKSLSNVKEVLSKLRV